MAHAMNITEECLNIILSLSNNKNAYLFLDMHKMHIKVAIHHHRLPHIPECKQDSCFSYHLKYAHLDIALPSFRLTR